MALKSSAMLPLGSKAPAFTLPNVVDGSLVSLEDFTDAKAYLLAFICNHCPYVIHLHDAFVSLAKALKAQEVAVFAISSNNPETHPQDSPEAMAKQARKHAYSFPYLFDESQAVAKAYQVACTPDFYVFDSTLKLTYRGRFDESRPDEDLQPDGKELKAAVLATLKGQPVEGDQYPSMGCSIKWKAGNEPTYA